MKSICETINWIMILDGSFTCKQFRDSKEFLSMLACMDYEGWNESIFLSNVFTLSQTSPCFQVSTAQVFRKHCWKRRNCSLTSNLWCPWSWGRASALQSWGPEFESQELVSTLRFFSGPHIRHEYWCSSQEAESREISISCKNLFLNRCKINMFKLTSNFSFSHSVFYPFWEPFTIFIKLKIVVCKCFVWKSLKFVVRESQLFIEHGTLFLSKKKSKHCRMYSLYISNPKKFYWIPSIGC